jgi:hypothetical protein
LVKEFLSSFNDFHADADNASIMGITAPVNAITLAPPPAPSTTSAAETAPPAAPTPGAFFDLHPSLF